MITLDGTSGKVYLGEIPTVEPEFTDELNTLRRAWRVGMQSNLRLSANRPNR